MPDEQNQTPAPEWRVAQHRIRNDLQTLAALLRLSRRRVPDNVLLDEYAEWLNALAALYDALPLWDTRDDVSLKSIVNALRGRCHLQGSMSVSEHEEVRVAAASGLAAALGVLGLLAFSCRNAAPGGTVTVNLSDDGTTARVETVFRTVGPPSETAAGWPPLSLSLAAEALDGQFATGLDGEDTVAVLAFPSH